MKRKLYLLLLLCSFVLCLCACENTEAPPETTAPSNVETVAPSKPTYSLENKTAEEIVRCIMNVLDEPLDTSYTYSDFMQKLEQTYSNTLWGEYECDEIAWVNYGVEEAMDGSLTTQSSDNTILADIKLKDYNTASQVYELLKTRLQTKYQDVKENKNNTIWRFTGSYQDYQKPGLIHVDRTIVEMYKCQDNDTRETFYQIRCCTLRDEN